MINMTIGLLTQTNMITFQEGNEVKSTVPVDNDGNLLESESLAYKIYNFQEDKYYLNTAQNLDQQYLQSGGDFFRGFFWFLEAFLKATVLINITLVNFGVPISIVWYFAIPVYFMYIVAIVQLISGRSFGGNT